MTQQQPSVPRSSDCVATAPTGEQFTVVAEPSGVIGWQYENMVDLIGLVLGLLGALWNGLGRIAFRFGWSVNVYDAAAHRIARRRYASKQAAIEALPAVALEVTSGRLSRKAPAKQ